MKRVVLILVCSFLCCFPTKAQNLLVGKTYTALVNESCHKMTGGGCMVYTYRKLQFEKDSVIVSYKIKASCVPKEREKMFEEPPRKPQIEKYGWSIQEGKVHIQGFDEYGVLFFRGENLFGQTKNLEHIGLGRPKKVEFKEERRTSN